MDASSTITGTGTSQSATQNPQDIGAPSLLPSSSNSLQAGGTATNTTNINTSSTVQGIPLSSISTSTVVPAAVSQSQNSYTPYLISAGVIIIVFAIITLVASNIVSNRHLAID